MPRHLRKFMGLATIAAALATSSSVQAFFPPIDPNQNVVVVTPTPNPIIPATTPTTSVTVPTVPGNPIRPTPTTSLCPRPTPTTHCVTPRPRPVDPCAVPEPATIVSGLVGLGAIGITALRRRKKSPIAPSETPTNN